MKDEICKKREIIEEFLKFAKEVYDAELCDYDLYNSSLSYIGDCNVEEIIDHFVKGE